MPLSLADVLSAQAGGGPVYEGGPDANVTPGGVLAALGLGGPSWLDAARKQGEADIAAYQRGGVPELMADTGQTQELAGGFGGGAIAGPIKAYHGSPYDFAKFDLSKIGTGEGAQAYGHGLYFAENENVANQYRKQLAGTQYGDAGAIAAHHLNLNKGDVGAAIEELTAGIKPRWTPEAAQITREAIDLLKSGKVDKGKMYEVNINAEPGQFIDFNLPIGSQSQQVKEALRNLSWGGEYAKGNMSIPGGNLAPQTFQGATEMAQAGIPGIRYLDQGSRIGSDKVFQVQSPKFPFNETEVGKWAIPGRNDVFPTREAAIASLPDRTSNYVVFNPEIVDILKKYGLAGLTMGGVLTAAGQEPAPSQ